MPGGVKRKVVSPVRSSSKLLKKRTNANGVSHSLSSEYEYASANGNASSQESLEVVPALSGDHEINSDAVPTLAQSHPAIYSDDPRAAALRNSIEPFIPIPLEAAKAGQCNRPVRVYADGVFDIFHAGHARALRQAKTLFPNVYLIVGVSPQHEVHAFKGQTVNTEWERYEALRHCRYIDEVYRGCPWIITLDFLDEYKIDFVAHDDLPYTSGAGSSNNDIYSLVKKEGRFAATQRTEGISTSDLISRVVRDYDHYVRRNLTRGYSRKDLNVGFLKEKEIRLKDRLRKANDKRKSVATRSSEMIRRWEENTKDFVTSFLDGFQSVQAARNIWNRSRGVFSRLAMSPYNSDDDDDQQDGTTTTPSSGGIANFAQTPNSPP